MEDSLPPYCIHWSNIDTLRTIFRRLDNLKYELESRVYTLDEDEMSSIFFCRDIAEQTIRIYDSEQEILRRKKEG